MDRHLGHIGLPAVRKASDHPALAAWQKVNGGGRFADIEALKVSGKSRVYRLRRALPDGRSIIAKHGPYETMRVERRIYEEILPRVPVAAPPCLGLLDAPDGTACWLFLEDAGGDVYVPSDAEHRHLAGRWLALLHTGAARLDVCRELPDRGAAWYARHLVNLRAALQEGERHPLLTDENRAIVRGVLRQCDLLTRGWNRIERECQLMPATCVHADFGPKNLRVRGSKTPMLSAFDWEMAGWGPLASDLTLDPIGDLVRFGKLAAFPDLDTYFDTVHDAWRGCTREDIGRWAALGLVLRLLVAMSWTSAMLFIDVLAPFSAADANEAIEDAVYDLDSYGTMMTSALLAAALGG